MSVTREGQIVTNGTGSEQVATLRHGERWMRLLLRPGESRSCSDMPTDAVLTSSADTSPMRGRITLMGGSSGKAVDSRKGWTHP